MPHNRMARVVAGVVMALAASALTALPQGKGILTQKTISLDMARAMAEGALEKCRADGYHVSVHVIDASGLDKIALRDDGSSETNFTVSREKAFTALTYSRPTSVMEKNWEHMSPARIIPGMFAVGGGLPIKAGDEIIGAIGVGGGKGKGEGQAHDSVMAEACAAAGLAKVADLLK